MEKPLIRRGGTGLTIQIEWASHTEPPTFWVVNLIDDNIERNGGTWGANTMGPAHVVLSFFGESQKVGRLCIFRNVGLDISILEELAKTIDIYYSNTDEPRRLRRKEDKIDDVEWTFLKRVTTEKAEGWQEIRWMSRLRRNIYELIWWRIMARRPISRGRRSAKLRFTPSNALGNRHIQICYSERKHDYVGMETCEL